ncbi:HPr family phosphocarrier protein [Marasmitruncus massiliensis]|jgi:phosphocarrier protein|uniref:HPr family phosphocarrier protein n=1 Tax=Marasmitruncus massiliensis TaxID=1944642 RepID=UPI000C7D60FB|nr:HPr family phosphocarrier protein [Marasmitruncus massiliensis]MBE6906871.1 HPr family phosphocarrier protein [Oscillospiraceae bacterium]
MKTVLHIIQDKLGIHARPAGQIVKLASQYSSDIKFTTASKTVDARRIMALMGLGVHQGDQLKVTFEGTDEAAAAAAFSAYLKESL